MLADLLSAPVGEATIMAALHSSAQRLAPVLDQIKQALMLAPVVHFDETGMPAGSSGCTRPGTSA